MHAIITAGGTLKADSPLFLETGIAKKALIPIAGKPMIQWVIDAIVGSRQIDSLIVVGLKEGDVDPGEKPSRYVEDQGSMVDNVLAGVAAAQEVDPNTRKILLSSSDIPLITSEIIDEFIGVCLQKKGEVYYTVVEKKTMEARFPDSQRTFTALKGGCYAGGDLMMFDTHAVNANIELIRGATGHRKNFLAQARLLGFTFIFRFIFRLMDLEEGERRARKAFNVSGHILDYHRAEIAMDVDKLHHYQLVKRELEARRS